MATERRKHTQLELDRARRVAPGHGGWRPGSGRPRRCRGVAHGGRGELHRSHPQHVTLRIVPGLAIRKSWLMPTFHAAIAASHKPGFRIVEFNVLANHLHLMTEADSASALGSGMNGLGTRLARRLNRALRRTGPVFDGRYHVRALRTPTEVRNALRYILLNARHHAAEAGRTLARGWLDPYSSAPWFDGWNAPTHLEPHVVLGDRPTATATTWLLTTGWRRYGLLSPNDIPGQSPTASRAAILSAPAGRGVRRREPPAQLALSIPASVE